MNNSNNNGIGNNGTLNKFNLIGQIVVTISKLIKTMGIFNVLFTFILLISTYIIIFQPDRIDNIILKIVQHQEKLKDIKHIEDLKNRENFELSLSLILKEIVISTNSDRCIMIESHNNGSSLNGVPYLKFSMISERLSDQFEMDDSEIYISQYHQNEHISNYIKSSKFLYENKYLIINNLQEERSSIDSYLYKILNKYEIKSLVMVGIFDYQNNNLIGALLLTSENKGNYHNTESLNRTLLDKTQIISNFLNNK